MSGNPGGPGTPAGEELVELEIDAIAAGGDGVGRDASGRVTFVPLTAPGDRVRVRIETAKGSWARGRMVELLEPAPDRRLAPCPVFGICGGCRLQHLPGERQAAAKRAIVAAALRRIGHLEVEVNEPIRAGDEFAYRNRVTLTVRREGAADPVAGFHGLHDPGEVIDCPNCLLAEPAVQRAWEALAPWDALPSGGELRVTIRASADGQVALLVEGGTSAGDRQAVKDRLPNLESYQWIDADGAPLLLAGRASFTEEWQGIRLQLDPGVFLQVNREVAAAMDDWLDDRVHRWAGPRIDGIGRRSSASLGGLRVSDLYAGVGVRAIRWARSGARVTSCEVDARACDSARIAGLQAGADVRIVNGKVEDHLGLLEADVVVVNPPRAGLGGPVREALASGPAGAVAYVSCDPATLARDLDQLSAAYRVREVQPFDAFPQTAHIETVAWLERRAADEKPAHGARTAARAGAADPDDSADAEAEEAA